MKAAADKILSLHSLLLLSGIFIHTEADLDFGRLDFDSLTELLHSKKLPAEVKCKVSSRKQLLLMANNKE